MGIRLNQSKAHQRARKILEQRPDDVAKVEIDAKPADLDAARQALQEDPKIEGVEAGEFAEKLDAFEKQLESAKLGIPGTKVSAKIGQWSLDALKLAPDESIRETVPLRIERKDGTTLELEAERIDLESSALLKKISALVNGGSAIPFMVGTVIGYGAGALSAVAAVGARALGKKHVSSALIRMATKHLILSTVTNLPVAGNAACLLCAARDARDHQTLTAASKAATVENTVNLHKYGLAKLPEKTEAEKAADI